MQSINKIHSTRMSLNDRFTIMQTVQPSSRVQIRRRRRSQSANGEFGVKSTAQNRRLLQQLDQRHMMRTALRLKKKSLKTNIPLRQRINSQTKNRIMKRGNATTLSVGPGGRLKRTNGIRNIGTMQADFITNPNGKRQLRRSNSSLNLAARLGVRGQQVGNNGRRRLIRNNVAAQRSRSRSRSRQNLIRSNSQSNLRRANSQLNLNRANSQVRGRSASRQRLQRSNSRNNLNARGRSNTRLPANRRIGSINGRLGVKTVKRIQQGVQRGRIMKRRNSMNKSNVQMRGIGKNGIRQRMSRSRTRVAQGNARNRSASRGRNNQQQNRPRQNVNVRGRGGRGRSRSRGRPGRQNTGGNKKQPMKTKEELDKELDQYMVNTKSNESDILMG